MDPCSQLRHNEEVQAGHIETWPLTRCVKKELHYSTTSPSGWAMAHSAAAVTPALGIGFLLLVPQLHEGSTDVVRGWAIPGQDMASLPSKHLLLCFLCRPELLPVVTATTAPRIHPSCFSYIPSSAMREGPRPCTAQPSSTS